VLRVLRQVALVCRFTGRAGRPKSTKPDVVVEAPNEIWAWDISYCRVGDSFWYLIAIIDMFSRKIVGHAVRPSATSDDVKDVFDKALANEGLLGMDAKMPKSLSDRGPQMRSKTNPAVLLRPRHHADVLAATDAGRQRDHRELLRHD
jgi:putative transposase